MEPKTELSKKLTIAIQALQNATLRNDGPGQHVAAEAIQRALLEVDALVEAAQPKTEAAA
jgi:hypothetical protein